MCSCNIIIALVAFCIVCEKIFGYEVLELAYDGFKTSLGLQHRSFRSRVFVIDSACAGYSVILDCISKLRGSRF